MMKLFQKLIKALKKFGINANKIELSANDILNLLAGNEINLGSKKITIKSDNFSVDENGKMICNNAIFYGGNIDLCGTNMKAFRYFDTDNLENKDTSHMVYIAGDKVGLNNGNASIGIVFATDENGKKYPYIDAQVDNVSYSTMTHEYIKTPKVIINKEGQAMYGKGEANDHVYRCYWTGSKLQFWVDETNVGTLSDKRLKKEIKDIDDDFIKIINEVEMKQFKVANRNGLISFGILAQDLMEIFKKYNKNPFDYEIVQETLYKDDDETIYYTIDYEQFLILKQKATDIKMKQLEKKIEEMEEKFNEINRLDK